MKLSRSLAIRGVLGFLILLSILVTFVSKMLLNQYEIVTNEDGLPTLDE